MLKVEKIDEALSRTRGRFLSPLDLARTLASYTARPSWRPLGFEIINILKKRKRQWLIDSIFFKKAND